MANNAYTFVQKTQPSEPSQLSNFSTLVKDGSHVAMTGVTGNGIQTVDVSATPLSSPIAFSNVAVTTLTSPLNASNFTIIPLTSALNISEFDPTVTTNYFTVPIGVPLTLDIGRQSLIYIKAASAVATGSSFFYNIV
jgi:hypothetical protein